MSGRKEMSGRETLEMMHRCSREIKNLRAQIDHLRPKAEAYDNISIVLGLLPRQSMGMGEDLAFTLDRRISEMTTEIAMANASECDEKAEG